MSTSPTSPRTAVGVASPDSLDEALACEGPAPVEVLTDSEPV